MIKPVPKRSLKARLLLELELEDGTKKTIEVHQLEAGWGIGYYDYRTEEVTDTGIEWTELTEMKFAEDVGSSIREPQSSDRHFLQLNLLALMSPAEWSEHKDSMRMIHHDQVEAGVDPYSLLLGRKPDDV